MEILSNIVQWAFGFQLWHNAPVGFACEYTSKLESGWQECNLSKIPFLSGNGWDGRMIPEPVPCALRLHQMRPLKNVQFRSRSRRVRILTTGIYEIFRGLKSERNEEIVQISADFERGCFSKVSPFTLFLPSGVHNERPLG